MAIGIRNKKEFLDAKRCFQLWFETSSLYKTQKVLFSEGVINPKTGKAPTVMGIWYAAWSWGLNNLSEAYKMVDEVYKAHGELLTKEEWKLIVTEKAKYLYSEKKFQKFKIANDL